MVTRKPSPEKPTIDTNGASHVTLQDVRNELWSATDSDSDAARNWGDASSERDFANRTGAGQATNGRDTPDSLKPGLGFRAATYSEEAEGNPWEEDATTPRMPQNSQAPRSVPNPDDIPEPLRPGGPSGPFMRAETNPFKRKAVGTATPSGTNTPPMPAGAPPPPPPTDAFAQMDLAAGESSNNPWKPNLDEKPHLAPTPPLAASISDQSDNVWNSKAPSRVPSRGPAPDSPALIELPGDEGSPAWDDDAPPNPSLPPLPQKSVEANEFSEDQHAWDDVSSGNKGQQPVPSAQQAGESTDGWNLIDHEPAPGTLSKQSTWENFQDEEEAQEPEQPVAPAAAVPASVASGSAAPALPPRRDTEAAPPQPPRPQTPSSRAKSETYQIKNINWNDATSNRNPRRSPILVQNANGPCPLVALVNALTLTTPADVTNTVLIETLRSREQISLNLLLEAVFDELMSERRSQPDMPLPDVTELYKFLQGLQTGMNVNPRYIPTPEVATAHKRTSLIHLHPTERGDLIPGTFEVTRDMKLYATFSIPLIHGWLPPKDDPVYGAMERQASSYDDVQNLLFREEELEDKLSNSTNAGLTVEEQQLYQDILTIKSFLSISATQLTPWGLDVITKAIKPGTVSILFRNDHFSTLYRHPSTHQLFNLVTDAGFYTHDEVVWESLADVNGERTEFFSGDFRLVGGPQNQAQPNDSAENWFDEPTTASNSNEGGSWQTVQPRRNRNNRAGDDLNTPMSPSNEQEDHDLALALQLQEEEEQRHQAEQAARRRESQLSEQFIEQQSGGRGGSQAGNRGGRGGRGGPGDSRGGSSISSSPGNPIAPIRTSSSMATVNVPVQGPGRTTGPTARPVQQVRSLVPPPNTTNRPAREGHEEPPPPTYEQASQQAAYVPPAGHPSHPASSPNSRTPRGQRRPSAMGTASPGMPAGAAGPSRGRPGAPIGQPVAAGNDAQGGRDKDCVVM